MKYPKLPDYAQKEFDDLARKFTICIHTQEYPVAESIVRDLYSRMLSWQKEQGVRYHKGFPLHNIGYSLYLQNKRQETVKYFVLAYVEDLLSSDNVDEADATPAGQTLLIGYKLAPELLTLLKEEVIGLKKIRKIPLEPEEVIREFDKSGKTYVDTTGKITVHKPDKPVLEFYTDKVTPPKEYPKRQFDLFDTEWKNRVFVGGSGNAIINYMRDIVNDIGSYDAVVVADFNMPIGVTIYQKCLALLHSCKYAFFDLTIQGGQLIEIERAPDYGIKTLAVWQKDREQGITEVLKSCFDDRGIRYRAYDKFDELQVIIPDFLAKPSV